MILSSSDLPALISALIRLADRIGEGINVTVTSADLVQDLREEVVDLRRQLDGLRRDYQRTEYLYRCSLLHELQLWDIVHDQDIDLPQRLRSFPYDVEERLLAELHDVRQKASAAGACSDGLPGEQGSVASHNRSCAQPNSDFLG